MISIDTNLKTRFERSWSKGRGRCKTWGVLPPVCLIQNAERESVYLETHLRSKNQLHHAFRLLCLHVKKGSNLSQSAIVCPAFIWLATIQNKFQSRQKAFLKILLFITTFRSDFFSTWNEVSILLGLCSRHKCCPNISHNFQLFYIVPIYTRQASQRH